MTTTTVMAENNQSQAEVVANILGVSGAGFRLSMILNAVSCEVSYAPSEIHTISKTVTTFALLLKQAGMVLQQAEAVHSDEAVQTAKQIAEESNMVFNEVNDMIERVRTRSDDGPTVATIQQRFKWYFNKKRIDYLLSQLESLKLSLSLMLQIIQLGRSMAATSKHDSPERVDFMRSKIIQERMEAQNTVIVHYFQCSEVDKLYEAVRKDIEHHQSTIDHKQHNSSDEEQSIDTNSSQLTIGPPPEYSESNALTKLSPNIKNSVGENLDQMRASSKDMVQVSDKAIDPLLEKWTRWREIREKRHSRPQHTNNRYNPAVHNLYDDDEDMPYHQRYHEREDSPKGYYLEGSTTDWRQPHSVSARSEAVQRRKAFKVFQPSVSAESSDVENSPRSSNNSKGRAPRHHVIDSSSESSESEQEKPTTLPKKRTNSTSHPNTTQNSSQSQEDKTQARSVNITAASLPALSQSSTTSQQNKPTTPASGRGPSGPIWGPPLQRPGISPDQNVQHHSFSTPPPAAYTHNANVSYQPTTSPVSPSTAAAAAHYTYFPTNHLSPQQSRYVPTPYQQQYPPRSLPTTVRPVSREGRPPRSPSRLAHSTSVPGTTSSRSKEEEKRQRHKQTRKNWGEGARNGLLAGGGIAMFLEALESLSV